MNLYLLKRNQAPDIKSLTAAEHKKTTSVNKMYSPSVERSETQGRRDLGFLIWPARVPDFPARLSPFFFSIKLDPIKALETTAKAKPFVLSETRIFAGQFLLFISSSCSFGSLIGKENHGIGTK